MRFIKTRPSAQDQDINVYEFAFGTDELKIILGILKTARKNIPDMPETHYIKSRLPNILRCFEKVLKESSNSIISKK